ncbi:MAG: hypothetical protein ABIO72_02540 [Patescibacteria group bacterium]
MPDLPTPTPVTPGTDNHHSEAVLFADKPPRLVVGVNRVALEPNRTLPDAKPGKSVPAAVGGGDAILAACGANYLTEIIDYVMQGVLEPTISSAWQTDAGKDGKFGESDEEENWAKKVAEIFMGLGYGGFADFSSKFPWKGTAESAKKRKKLLGTPYVYQRFQLDSPVKKELRESTDPDEREAITNDDPCYSIIGACQQLATYTLISRGFTLEDDMLDVGLSAASNAPLPIFSKKRGGRWFHFETKRQKAPTPAGSPEPPPEDDEHGDKPLDATYATGLGLTPGSCYCYDPFGRLSGHTFHLVESDFIHEKDGSVKKDSNGQPMVSPARIAQIWNTDANYGAGDRDTPDAAHFTDGLEIYQLMSGERIPIYLPHIQATGSHIWPVLRIKPATAGGVDTRFIQSMEGDKAVNWNEMMPHPDNPALQVKAYAAGATTGRTESGWMSSAYRGNHYVGLGVPPAATRLADATYCMERARPVGLARMVIVKRPGPKTVLQLTDVLYVSQFMRMWGDGSLDNYSTSQFLFSLRNTPYYADIQVYWFLYSPNSFAADVMFAEGARGLHTPDLFEAIFAHEGAGRRSLNLQTDLFCTLVMTHDADGLSQVAWRYGGTSNNVPVPQPLALNFVERGGKVSEYAKGQLGDFKGFRWDGQYIHPAIGNEGWVSVPDVLSPGEVPEKLPLPEPKAASTEASPQVSQ